MEKLFGREYLEKAFDSIGQTVSRPLGAYLLGGGAMCFRGQKAGTKDLDIVFKSDEDARAFADAARKAGFGTPKKLGKIYLKMEASDILEDPNEFRLDIFSKSVCRALQLSKSMISRAVKFKSFGKLIVWMVANEDIVLFKGITERDKDVDDIASVIRQTSVDWGIILEECKAQSGDYQWYGPLLDKLFELQEKYGLDIPVKEDLERLRNQELIRWKYKKLISEGKSRKETLAELKKMGFENAELEFLEKK